MRALAVVILYVSLSQVSASCEECRCPQEVPRCAAGVSLVPDSCGCCTVCAQQLFEDCSETQPCDHTKGLECNFGGGSVRGVCRAKSIGRTCEYNSKIYQSGESFRPNCKHQCTCMDGAVGCVSLCPHEFMLPRLSCAKPKLVKVPGLCCQQFVCSEDVKTKSVLVKKHSKGGLYKDEPANNQLPTAWRREPKTLPAFRSPPKRHTSFRRAKCVSQTTTWSSCSKSCGTGVSIRMTNSNSQCKLVKESRICEIRPCNRVSSARLKTGQKCSHIKKASRPIKLSYSGCQSLKMFRPRYCGSCSDVRCCRPHRTHTLPVRFQCRNGDTFIKMVMMIQSCKCNLKCSRGQERRPALYRPFNDVRKLKM
ncbi:CCN family member 1-like isoform 2-T2 [Aulostomus maculatus]